MSSFRVSNINVSLKKSFMALAVVVAAVAPGLSAFVSADQITDRSVTMSSSTKGAEAVSYDIQFSSVSAATHATVEFCSNSPVFGATCVAPTGFDATDATATGDGTIVTQSPEVANKVVLSGTVAAGTPFNVTLGGITNPEDEGSLYVRIATYESEVLAVANVANTAIDSGSVALLITDGLNVSASVPETMSFCVSSEAIGPNCEAATVVAPSVKLGQPVPGSATERALVAGTISTGEVFTQISTNASKGAVVSLKSSADGCGGLVRAGAPGSCDIKPSTLNQLVVNGPAVFGLLVQGTALTLGTGVEGVLPSGSYNPTQYYLGYGSEDAEATGVTSPYGEEIFNTNSVPANSQAAKLTFGATVTNSTPAGLYSTDISLIATGTF